MSEESDKNYAARFQKPGEASAQGGSAPPASAPPPRSQGLGEMLEDTLTAPIKLGALFMALAPAPPPSWPVMAANALIYWAAFFGINLIHVAISDPAALNAASGIQPPTLVLAALGALAAAFAGSFAGAGALHLLAKLGGAKGNYRRSYQIFSLLSLMAPLQATLNWLPLLWPVPVAVGAYLAIVACEHMHQAPPGRLRAVMCLGMLLTLGAQWTVRTRVEQAAESYRALHRQTEALDRVVRQLDLPAATGAPLQGIDGAPAAAVRPGAAAGASSLDMVGGLGAVQAQQMAQAQVMLQQVKPMLDKATANGTLTPAQARQYKDATQMLGQLQQLMQSGGAMTPAQKDQLMRNLAVMQQQMIKQAQSPQAAPSKGRRKAGSR